MSTNNKKNRAFSEYDFILFNATTARKFFKCVRAYANKNGVENSDMLSSFNSVPLEKASMVNPWTYRTNCTGEDGEKYECELIFSCTFVYQPDALTERESNELRLLSALETAAPDMLTSEDNLKLSNLKQRNEKANSMVNVRIHFDDLIGFDTLKMLAANFISENNLTNHYFN